MMHSWILIKFVWNAILSVALVYSRLCCFSNKVKCTNDRESCILVDPANSSQSSKQYVAIVVNHETAHQWFGNLVTMEWWTHLWLNEGEFRRIVVTAYSNQIFGKAILVFFQS